MAQTFLTLPPDGSAVAVPASSPHKTFIVGGDWKADSVTLEISANGTDWDIVGFFGLSGQEPTPITFSANYARARANRLRYGTPTPMLGIDTVSGAVSSVNVPLSGAPVNVSALTNKHKTFIVAATPANLTGKVIVEGSANGGLSFNPLFVAQGQDRSAPYNFDGYLDYVRARDIAGNTAGMRVDIVTEPFECGTPTPPGDEFSVLKFSGALLPGNLVPSTVAYLADGGYQFLDDTSVIQTDPLSYRMPAGTLSHGRIRVIENGVLTQATLVEVLKNGAAVGSVSIPAGSTGNFDIDFEEAYAEDDLLDVRLTVTSPVGGTQLGLTLTMQFAPDVAGVGVMMFAGGLEAGAEYFQGNLGAFQGLGFFSNPFLYSMPPGELANFRLNVLTNTTIEDTTFEVELGGTPHTVVVPAGLTGSFDIAVIGTAASGDDLRISNSGPTFGQLTFSATMEFVGDGDTSIVKFSARYALNDGTASQAICDSGNRPIGRNCISLDGYRMPPLNFSDVRYALVNSTTANTFPLTLNVRQNGAVIATASLNTAGSDEGSVALDQDFGDGDRLTVETIPTNPFSTFTWITVTLVVAQP